MNAIVTISIGDKYKELSNITHNSIRNYAANINAEFIIIDKQTISNSPPFEKFQIYNLLNKYERIIYIDSDIIIRKDCPNLFNIVPFNKIGLFNEAPYCNRIEAMKQIAIQYNEKINWDGRYFNTGVMVISRLHKSLFKKPEIEIDNFYEQSYINLKISKEKVEVFELSYKYNRMSCVDPIIGEDRQASYILHYAGCPYGIQELSSLIMSDLDKWTKDTEYKTHILFKTQGGIGDIICSEPTIRYLNKIYKNLDLTIETQFPTLFKHFNCTIVKSGEFKPKVDTPYVKIESMTEPTHSSWNYLTPSLTHTVDYISLLTCRTILPDIDKSIKLDVKEDDINEVKEIINNNDLSKLILVHPGKGWNSKTFPKVFWENLINTLSEDKVVAVIGKYISEEQGTVDLELNDKVIDLRNLLTLEQLIAIISSSKLLITNDSAPVHIAGAFDNNIFLIPSCKHPDWVLPFRNGNKNYKTKSFYKKLMIEDYDLTPTNIDGETIDYIPNKYEDYLPDIQDIIIEVNKI